MSDWVFTLEGRYDLTMAPSLREAAGQVEAIDVDHGEYDFFMADGSVVVAQTDRHRVLLALTAERRHDELRERVLEYLKRADLSADLAEDPDELARACLRRERDTLWPR